MNALAGIALSVVLAAGSPTSNESTVATTGPRTAQELRLAVDGLLAKETAATKSADRAEALREMAALSQEIAKHPTIGKHAAGSMRNRLAGRLKRAAVELKANAQPGDAAAVVNAKPAKIEPLPAEAAVLAQQGGAFPFDPPPGDVDGAAALAELFEDTVAPETWEKAGGPGVIRVFPGKGVGDLLGQVPGAGNFGGGPAPLALDNDQSEALIELIQEVIAPDTWDVAGGAGAAKFFKNKNVLVVRQTDEVQEGLFDVVNQLRRN
jgi:hypothetical protein